MTKHKPDCAFWRNTNDEGCEVLGLACTCGADKPVAPETEKACTNCGTTEDACQDCIRYAHADCAVVDNWTLTPPAPTADEVREAQKQIVEALEHDNTMQLYRCAKLGHLHTILAALDRAQEEARIMTVSRDHYVSELALAQGEVERYKQKYVTRYAYEEVSKHRDALRATNAAQAEEIKRLREALEEIRDTGLGFELAVKALKETSK